MKFKRLAAVLISMIMTVEAIPSFVFAVETDFRSAETTLAGEAESSEEDAPEAEETKPSEAPVKESQASKKVAETKPEETEASVDDGKDESKPEEKEPVASETDREEETQPSATEPAGTEPEETAAGDKEDAGNDDKTPANGVDTEPSGTATETDESKFKDGEVITETDRPVETHIISTTPDNDKQLEAYFKKGTESQVEKPKKRLLKSASAGTRLDKTTAIAYNYIKEKVAQIAAGTRTSTKIEIPITLFYPEYASKTWTAEDLGISGKVLTSDKNHITAEASSALRELVQVPVDLTALDNALLSDLPYELYWFDKTLGVRLYSYTIGAKRTSEDGILFISSGLELWLSVSKDYADPKYDASSDPKSADGKTRCYKTDTAKISRVNTAIKNAASYVNTAKDKTDYQKLLYYCNTISSLVEYDFSAAEGKYANGYGDPWQIISVFDGNTKTNVVCEGYAKAFMYLCDLSTFKGDISCITVTGDTGGGHMWNVVNMDDGKNYIVDVTNIDNRSTAAMTKLYRDALFLNGCKSPSEHGYSFKIGSMPLSYTYDEDSLETYSDDQLTLAEDRYMIKRAVKLGETVNGTASLSASSALPDDEVKILTVSDTGFMVDTIKVNGKAINGYSFLMTGVEANVEVTFKKAPYDINLRHNTGGTITTDKAQAYYSDRVNVTITADPGYKVKSVLLNGETFTEDAFDMPNEAVTLEVEFEKIMYPVTVTSSGHGTATADCLVAGVGDTVTLDLVSDEGYYVESVFVNGVRLNGNIFTMLPEEVNVEVVFDVITQLNVGDVLTDANSLYKYKVTNNAMNGTGTVSYVGSESTAAAISIPATVSLKGVAYKVTRIAAYAFNKNATVTSVYVGTNILVIESRAFVACPKLVKINGGLRLTTICNKAVVNCPKLNTFIITSAALKTIGAYSFYGDKSLKTIYINKTTKLTKKSVKKSLKGSKVKTVKVKKSKVKKYKKYFTKKNSGRKVTVKK